MEKPEQQEHHGGTGNEAGAAMQAATYHVAYSTIKEKNRSLKFTCIISFSSEY